MMVMVVCFLFGAEDSQPQDFSNLADFGDYSSFDDQPKYDPNWDDELSSFD